MRTIDVGNIAARAPVDRTAARVIGSGFKYEPSKKVQTTESATPFKTRPVPRASFAQLPDLTGVRFGRFTVMGLAEEVGGKWSCRCDCGTYALRKTSAVRNPANSQDRCEHCRHLVALKRSAHFREHGFNSDAKRY